MRNLTTMFAMTKQKGKKLEQYNNFLFGFSAFEYYAHLINDCLGGINNHFRNYE